MSFLKSLFITGFTIYLLSTVVFALMQVLRGIDPAISWVGLMLSGIGPLSFFGWIYIGRPARTGSHPVGYSMVSGMGLAMTLAMSWRYGPTAGSVHLWAGIGVIGWLLYLRWYSSLVAVKSNLLAPGRRLPEFTLRDLEGKLVHSNSFRGRPHVLLLFRGNWCPFCTSQIKELAQKYRDLRELGTEVVLISPQSLEKNRQLAARFDIPMRFLHDPENKAAKSLGLFHAWGTPMGLQVFGYDSDTVLPATIVADADGGILYSHHSDNYRIRPDPADYMDIFSERARA